MARESAALRLGRFVERFSTPLVVSLVTLIFAFILLQRLLTHDQTEIQATVRAQAVFAKHNMEAAIRARTLVLERLAARWRNGGQGMESDAVLAMQISGSPPANPAIEWVDPALHVRWVAPRKGNGVDLGADLNIDARLRGALHAAVDTGRAMVTRSVSLRQGGRGFLVCVPVYAGDALQGFLLGVYRYQDFLDSILSNMTQDYSVKVYDDEQEIYSQVSASSPAETAWAQEQNIEIGQLTWRTRVWPKTQTLASMRSPLPEVTFVGGLIMAVLLAFATYSAKAASLHAGEVAAANKELEREIASREQVEEALRHAQKMEAVGRLAGGVAHDFNNLLTVVRGHAALLLARFGQDNALRTALNEILRTTDRASSLTRQLLAFSRKQFLQPRVLDLNSLLAQAANLMPPALGADIRLVIDPDPELGNGKADAAQIEQVIMNLAFNARDAMPHGGEVAIRTANVSLDEAWTSRFPGIQPGPYVMLSVRDTGCGMDPETQAHVFEPFFTTKDRSKGTGLGLATVYGTVNQSGGCVTVSSEPGHGTVVEVYLPRVDEPVEVTKMPQPPPSSLEGSETILVVEDDDAVRHMTREFLTIKGYTPIEARNAAEAIQDMQDHQGPIDLVLTDVMMPGMKGGELGERLAKLRPGTKVLYMSAYTEDAIMNFEMLGPDIAFIEKPFSPDDLARKVREVLGTSKTTLGAESVRHHRVGHA